MNEKNGLIEKFQRVYYMLYNNQYVYDDDIRSCIKY